MLAENPAITCMQLGGELHVGGNSWIRHQGQEELLGASSKFGCNLGISPMA